MWTQLRQKFCVLNLFILKHFRLDLIEQRALTDRLLCATAGSGPTLTVKIICLTVRGD